MSCADIRWPENFASILYDMGLKLKYEVIMENEQWINRIQVQDKESNEWILLENYLEDPTKIDKSKRELITKNVVTTTRYFQQRVKAFIAKIVLGKNNSMIVKY